MELINTRSVNCIYCDDVRHEIGGKVTVVGMYSEGIPVQFPPQGSLSLPKLCLIASVRTPVDQPFQRLRCELRLDDEVLHGVDIPAEVVNSHMPVRNKQKGIAVQLIMEFGNFVIPREGALRFVAIVEDTQIYECPGLEFIKNTACTPADTPAPSAT